MKTPIWDMKSQFAQYKDLDVFDCMLAEYVLCEGRYPLTLEEAFKVHGVDTLEALKKIQEEIFSQCEPLRVLFAEIEMPLTNILWDMEQKGITLNGEKLRGIGQEIDREVLAITID